ncbi:MAG: DMT family transporter [Actinoallomurus sp.]
MTRDIGGGMIFLVGLAAAGLLGLGFVAQQHAAYREPLGRMLHPSLLLHLMHKPLWLAGLAAMVGGQILGALALSGADVGRVEPLLATNLLFALVIGRIVCKANLSWNEWLGGILASGGIALFLVLGKPRGERPTGPESDRWLAAAAIVSVALILVWIGRRSSLQTRAMLLASAAGMLFGLQDAVTRGLLLRIGHGLGAIIASWQPYALVIIAICGLLLAQSAFDAAPLRVSLPAATAAEPLTGILLGAVVFTERFRLSAGPLAGELIGLAMMVIGIFILGRSPYLAKPESEVPGSPAAKLS